MSDSRNLKHEFQYNESQKNVVRAGRDTSRPHIGNIDDLDPKRYSTGQMFNVALGRGDSESFGNIDDLNPQKYNANQMRHVSHGRGNMEHYANIDHLDPEVYDEGEMYQATVKEFRTEHGFSSGL